MSRIHTTKRRDFLKGACGLVAAGGASSFVPQLSMLGTALAQGTFNNYRALVCLYLDGGNDSWNLLIPATPARHSEYQAARGGLYAGSASSLGVPISGGGGAFLPNALPLLGTGNRVQQANGTVSVSGGNAYALNPFVAQTPTNANTAGIHRVYNRADAATQRMAFIANVGPLVEPLRKTGFNTFRRPPQLYSHNDQTNLWQIGGGGNSSDPNGWGGRMAGMLLGAAPGSGLSPCISIAGQTRYLVGSYTSGAAVIPYRLSTNATNPSTSLNNYSASDTASAGAARRAVMRALMDETYPQAFSQEYGLIVDRSLDLADTINSAIAGLSNPAPPAGSARANFNTILNGNAVAGIGPGIPGTNIGNQLRQVARMIAVSRFGQGTIQATRQVYFVRTGGYDTHDGQITSATAANGHHGLLQQISQALAGFDAAMRALAADPAYNGLHNEVLTMSMSEFARTINSNGNGTDHAWGAVQLMMGGAVQGNGNQGQIIGPYPRQILGLTQNDSALLPLEERGECFNRGEFLPRIAVDQIGATVARWMGVSDANLPLLFPNIDNFANASATSPIAFRSRVIPGLLAGV
jgi:uncharacterized protein (DUF1501 family)